MNNKKANTYKDNLTKSYALKRKALLGESLVDKADNVPSWEAVINGRKKEKWLKNQ